MRSEKLAKDETTPMSRSGQPDKTRWNLEELFSALDRFEEVLQEPGLREDTVRTYVDRTTFFLRWLGGDYEPQGAVGS